MEQEIENLHNKLRDLEMNYWLSYDVFSFQWWIISIINLAFLILLFVLIDRDRIYQIALAFVVSFILDGTFDDIGKYFGWWSYPHQFIQFTERFNAVNFAVVPVVTALLYQMFITWRMYLVAGLVMSFIYSFIGLPLFVYLGITELTNWTYSRSFIALMGIGILVKVIVDSIGTLKHQSNRADFGQSDRGFFINLSKKRTKAR